jgi:hypothetical protein
MTWSSVLAEVVILNFLSSSTQFIIEKDKSLPFLDVKVTHECGVIATEVRIENLQIQDYIYNRMRTIQKMN